MNPDRLLSLTGSLYIFPGYISLKKGYNYHASTCFLLAFTSFVIHNYHHPTFLIIDQTALLNYLISSFYIGFYYNVSKKTIGLGVLSVVYSAYIYIIGKHTGTMVWDNNIYVRITYHSLMHLSTSSVVYVAVNEATDKN